MRVGFFGQTGPYAPPALRHLLAGAAGFEIVLVVDGKRTLSGRLEHRLRKARPGPLPAGDSLTELAQAAGIPVLESCDVNAPTAVRTVADFALDWIVCVGFDRLFRPALLATAKRGALNAHPSLLPEWRGPSPLFWALRAGQRRMGVTVHAMDDKEDHGPIYAQAAFVAPHRASGDDLYRLAASVAAPLLADTLERAVKEGFAGIPQEHTRASRAPRPKPEDAHVEPALWGCEQLVDFCCAAPFFRSAWLRFGREVFFAHRGLRAELGRRLPAQYAIAGTTLIVQCQDGLAYLEIQA